MEELSLSRKALFDAERLCELYCGYQMKPDEEAHDGLRGDVFSGAGYFVPLLNEFLSGENRIVDTFHADGITAGYFGIYYGYLDFIAWDLKAVLDAAVSVFEQSGIDWVMFHTFRQDADGVLFFTFGVLIFTFALYSRFFLL